MRLRLLLRDGHTLTFRVTDVRITHNSFSGALQKIEWDLPSDYDIRPMHIQLDQVIVAVVLRRKTPRERWRSWWNRPVIVTRDRLPDDADIRPVAGTNRYRST